jgi:hypothetical protein
MFVCFQRPPPSSGMLAGIMSSSMGCLQAFPCRPPSKWMLLQAFPASFRAGCSACSGVLLPGVFETRRTPICRFAGVPAEGGQHPKHNVDITCLSLMPCGHDELLSTSDNHQILHFTT